MGDYSSQAITDYKKTLAHKAIKMMFDEKGGWEGDAATGFNQNAMVPYPSLSGRTLPPVTGPTGVVQFFVIGASMNAHGQWEREPGTAVSASGFPPGSRIVREEEIDGLPGYVVEVNPWTDCYEPWLKRIEQALEGWDSIPDHASFDTAAGKAREALTVLTPLNGFAASASASEPWRPTFSDPNRTNAFDLFSTYVGADVESDMVYAFRNKYGPTRVGTVLQNQGQIVYGLGLILTGERELWKQAGTDIMALCADAEKAFNYSAPGGGVSIDLKVIKAFLDLGSAFAPPNIKPFLAGASAIAGFLQAVIPENKAETTPPPALSAGTAEGVAKNFEEAVLTLRRALFAQEGELNRCARQLSHSIGTVAPEYLHIHPSAGLDPGVTTSERINVHTGALRDVGINQIPVIASVFAQAADDTYGMAPAPIWTRGWPLGYGTTGALEPFTHVLEAFDQVATGSARELKEAGRRLATAAGWLEQADRETDAAFTDLQDELARGKTEWAPTPHPVEVPGGRPGIPI